MPVRLLDRAAPVVRTENPGRPRPSPDPGYDALPRLTQLRAALLATELPGRSRWNEPPVFFFDRRRQADFELARPPRTPCDPFAELGARIAAELPALCDSVEVRRVARALEGLHTRADALGAVCPAAKELTELLAIPDDEVILVLHPERRAGFRFAVRGIADVGQFHILAADAMPGPRIPERFVAACREVKPAAPAGVPMLLESRYQMYAPAALSNNGELPAGLGGCEHWLWPHMPLTAIPRVNGERVVLLGPPAYRATWEVTRRFPAMPAELSVVEVLNPFRVAEELTRLTGCPVSAKQQAAPEPVLAKAA